MINAEAPEIERERIAEAVERYCAAGHAVEDLDLIGVQVFNSTQPSETLADVVSRR